MLPILMKSELTTEPIFRRVWGLAYEKLKEVEEVVFIGYSMPRTDIAMRFLFSEALHTLGPDQNTVVNKEESVDMRRALTSSYCDVLPQLTQERFNFEGAFAWIDKT